MKVLDRTKTIGEEPAIIGNARAFAATLDLVSDEEDVQIYRFEMRADIPSELPQMSVAWRMPIRNIKGEWRTGALYEKRLKADWEHPSVVSRVSVDAPVICLFGHEDENILSIACADVINTLEMETPVREENSFIYCKIGFFTEKMPKTAHYSTEIRIDKREIHFAEALENVADWWTTYEPPTHTPEGAKLPLYSTWYSYHQSITSEGLLKECEAAAKLGYKAIIVDDGWQTMDNNRGYDFTGDWLPERMPDMADFVQKVHDLDMMAMLWYSVPFCGKKSQAYQRFKGKFLTENHHWAPVFDPRYPEVREYLISKYVNALKNWNLDGFKLDFIDDFKVYPETELTLDDGRDYASVNAGVDRLMTDVINALKAIKPDVLIEFRQKYIGPAMRKYGNMFRAFDCPNDSATNRLRTTDVKLLCGSTAVHSDMFTWHYDEPVEYAALQITNILFSVPQISVRLAEVPEDHLEMIAFYTNYWNRNKSILLDGDFVPYNPLANYPVLSASDEEKIIYGVFDHQIVTIEDDFPTIDLINGKIGEQIVFELLEDYGKCRIKIYDCMGNLDWESEETFEEGIHALDVPPNGMICLEKT